MGLYENIIELVVNSMRDLSVFKSVLPFHMQCIVIATQTKKEQENNNNTFSNV